MSIKSVEDADMNILNTVAVVAVVVSVGMAVKKIYDVRKDKREVAETIANYNEFKARKAAN